MSRHLSRVDRFAQMSKQEEVIAKKRQEILEKQKTAELAKQVAAAQSIASKQQPLIEESASEDTEAVENTATTIPNPSTSNVGWGNQSKIKNTFCNDGSFLTHFKKILEKHKPEPPPPQIEPQVESELKPESEIENQQENEQDEIIEEQQQLEQNQHQQYQQHQVHQQSQQQQQQQHQNQQQQHQQQLHHQNNIQSISMESQMLPTEVQHPQIAPNSYFNLVIPPPMLNLQVTVPPPPPPPPPPVALQNCIPPLYMIPPPEPLQLNTIPPPKEFDLNAIPKPEFNLEAIQVPSEIKDKVFSDNSNDSITLPSSIEQLIDLVADFGDGYEDKIRSHKNALHPSLWFLFEKDSEQYISYRKQMEACRLDQKLQEQEQLEQDSLQHFNLAKPSTSTFDDKYDPECVIDRDEDSDDEYMRGMMDRNRDNLKRRIECRNEIMEEERQREEKKKQRKSRWGEKSEEIPSVLDALGNQNKPILTAVQRTDPALLQYARQNYGTIDLEEDDWKKCEEHFKVNLLYQDMLRKRQEIDKLARSGKFKYEYDSDEDVTGGTWEHKLRNAEMEATNAWASALTKQSEGKHHIGDFLPPEELKKFMEQYEAKKSNRQPDLSDYKEYKLREDNVGFQMLQKLGWKEGQGLGSTGTGIVDPVNKAPQREGHQGLGVASAASPEDCDNEYDAYRKRMMLAYRFRPNPLNNPRRAYY